MSVQSCSFEHDFEEVSSPFCPFCLEIVAIAFLFCRQFHYFYSFPFLELPWYLFKGWQKLCRSIITCIGIFIIRVMHLPHSPPFSGGGPSPSFVFLLDRMILGVTKNFGIFDSCHCFICFQSYIHLYIRTYQFPFRRLNLHMFKALWDWNLDTITEIKLKFNNVVSLPCKLMTSAAILLVWFHPALLSLFMIQLIHFC